MAKKSTAPYCVGGHALTRLIGWTFDTAQNLYVCGECRKPSKIVYELELENNG